MSFTKSYRNLINTRHGVVVDEMVRRFPPLNEITGRNKLSPRPMVYDPDYLNSLPMVPAYGLALCYRLAIDDPDRAVNNPDSLAILALGKSNF